MRQIERKTRFRRDYKRELKGPHGVTLESELLPLLALLATDRPLPIRYRDHMLTGNWQGHRDCHLKPDLVLIYQKPDPESLILVRLGSYAELEL